MNKIKLMYDVVRTMKKRETINGSLKVEAKKNEAKIFGFENEFEKDMKNGQGKSKFSTEMDYNGKQFKHESSTEFKMGEGHDCHHHRFMCHPHGHMHGHMHGRLKAHMNENPEMAHKLRQGSIKGKLNKIALLLSILDAVQVEERAEGFMLSLNSNDIPEDLKKELHESLHNHHEQIKAMHGEKHEMFGDTERQCMMKELHSIKEHNLNVNVFISKDYEIEKAIAQIKGKQDGEQGETNEMNLKAELNLK